MGGEILNKITDGCAVRDVEAGHWPHGAVEMKEALVNFCFQYLLRDLGGKRCAPDVLFLPDDRHTRGHGRVAQRHHQDLGDGLDGAHACVEGVDLRGGRLSSTPSPLDTLGK